MKIKLSISKNLNPMFGKKHKLSSIKLISVAKSKSVYMYKVIEGKMELFNIYSSSVENNEFK